MPDLETAIKKLEELEKIDDSAFVAALRDLAPATLALLRAMKAEILKHRSDWDGTHGMLPPWWLATDAAERDFIAAVGGGE